MPVHSDPPGCAASAPSAHVCKVPPSLLATAARPTHRAATLCCPLRRRAPPRPPAVRVLPAAPLAVAVPAPRPCASREPPARSSSAASPEPSAAHRTRRSYHPAPSPPALLPQTLAPTSAGRALLWWQIPPHRECPPRDSAPGPPSTPPAGRALDRCSRTLCCWHTRERPRSDCSPGARRSRCTAGPPLLTSCLS